MYVSLQLLHLGKDYPAGADYFRGKLKTAFMKNKDVKDPKEIETLIARGEFVIKELEALYMLRKYRTLKRRYYKPDWSTSTTSVCVDVSQLMSDPGFKENIGMWWRWNEL